MLSAVDFVASSDATEGQTEVDFDFAAASRQVVVSTRAEFVDALKAAQPGDEILVAPGNYAGKIWVSNIHGQAGASIVIRALDPLRRPVFDNGNTSGQILQISRASYLEVRDLIFQNTVGNGLNIDDGDPSDPPSHDILIDNLLVRNLGTGNHDGIKLSGVDKFRVTNCVFEAWGTGGAGIDMVGCHDGVVEGSIFRNGVTKGIQAKGGSRDVLILGNRFENAGLRAVQIGGTTDLYWFRPAASTINYEAKDITVEHNVFIGGQSAVAFVNSEGGLVRNNTIYRPTKWIFRILHEQADAGFIDSRNGVIQRNIIVWDSSLSTAVNIGSGTEPATFRFVENWWYNVSSPAASVPVLPSPETGGVYGIDPRFQNASTYDLRLRHDSPAIGYGADRSTADTTAPVVQLTSPNGGQNLTTGGSTTITWTATDNMAVASVDLYYSADGGSTYTLIVAGLSNSGSYAWTLPATATTQGRVRVVARDAAGNSAADASDANFTVADASPTSVAADGFETGTLTGGSGWSDPAWSSSGHVYIVTDTAPAEGTRHARL
ncbi:MAG: right-handed parallel beta-helix repeat-containing protein, partial [Planctomycetaceae bacterium]|nr:right-handed parallel beta-helix repeat-containing protein [Planctomycetaceae bacterium]